jgi:hypothetical protein
VINGSIRQKLDIFIFQFLPTRTFARDVRSQNKDPKSLMKNKNRNPTEHRKIVTKLKETESYNNLEIKTPISKNE